MVPGTIWKTCFRPFLEVLCKKLIWHFDVTWLISLQFIWVCLFLNLKNFCLRYLRSHQKCTLFLDNKNFFPYSRKQNVSVTSIDFSNMLKLSKIIKSSFAIHALPQALTQCKQLFNEMSLKCCFCVAYYT